MEEWKNDEMNYDFIQKSVYRTVDKSVPININ